MPPPENEESAKFQILAPTLRSLGWDTSQPEEVIYELQVGGNRGGGRADIVLKSNDRIVALIEAKAPGANLNHHVGQVLTYAFHEGVDICVLTTGLEWWLYLPREQGPPQDRRFAILKLADDPIEQLLGDLHAFLSKEMLVDGRAEKRAQAVLRASHEAAQLSKEVPGIWQEMLKEPDDELLEILGRRVYEKVSLRPTKPQLVAALQGSPIPLAAIAPEGMASKTSPIPQQQAKSGQRKKNPKPVAMELWGQHFGVETAADAFKKVVDLLFERHRDEFHRVLELRGHKYPHAAPDLAMLGPRSQQNNYEHEASGYFFDLHLSNNNKIRRARQLLEHFDHDSAELKLLYETPSAERSLGTASSTQSDQGAESGQRTQSSSPVAMELWGECHGIESHSDALRKVVDTLFKRHSDEFHSVLELRGRKHPYVTRNLEMLGPSSQKSHYLHPESGYYFDLHLSGKNKVGRIHLLLKRFGYDPTDLKILYE